jgi:hypothetical protein
MHDIASLQAKWGNLFGDLPAIQGFVDAQANIVRTFDQNPALRDIAFSIGQIN